jgi:hypothetical protein
MRRSFLADAALILVRASGVMRCSAPRPSVPTRYGATRRDRTVASRSSFNVGPTW